MSTEEFDKLRRLHESANRAIEKLQAKNMELQEENSLLLKKLINCQQALDINKEIMRNALTEQNRIQETYGQEIQELKNEIKELKHGRLN